MLLNSECSDFRLSSPVDLRGSTFRAPGRDPLVEIECTDVSGGHARFEIRDDGPGIPEHELAVLETGDETPLEHGSGLGLWLATWGVASLGGEVDFETDGAGTTAILELPGVAGSSTEEPERDEPYPVGRNC